MPFSFSRIFLGKKATIVEEEALPCRPREVVPMAVDAVAVVSKTRSGLTKIGRALKQKLRLNTSAPIPAGHGPLAVTSDEPFSPFSRRLQLPITPSLPSLPHIPDVSSTLGRDIRNATRFALLAAARGANSQAAHNDIYTTTPYRKRRTRSSSVLGGIDLPRPGTPLGFEILRPQYHGPEREGPDSSILPFLIAPVDAPLIWDGDEVSTYSSEYNEVANVLPLGISQDGLPPSPAFTGHHATYIVHPVPRRHWYVQQYLDTNAQWSMPLMPASDETTLSNESFAAMPNLDFGVHQARPASSVYSPFPPRHDTTSNADTSGFFSTVRTRNTTYSSIKLTDQAQLFSPKSIENPPAILMAQKAQPRERYNLGGREFKYLPPPDNPFPSLRQPLSSPPAPIAPWEARHTEDFESLVQSSESQTLLVNEQGNTNGEVQATALATLIRRLDRVFEPRPSQTTFININAVVAHEGDACDEVSTSTILFRNQENTPLAQRTSIVSEFVRRHAPEATILPGPARNMQIVTPGLCRFISGFDLFLMEEQQAFVESASSSGSSPSSKADHSRSTSGAFDETPSPTEASLPTPPDFDLCFTHDAFKSALQDIPTIGGLIHSRKYSNSSPHAKNVAFAKLRRISMLVDSIKDEFESIHEHTEKPREQDVLHFVEMMSELHDIKDDWYQNDDDFADFEDQVANQHFFVAPEEQYQHLDRDRATKDALICMQNRLASTKMKLADLQSMSHSPHSCEYESELFEVRGRLQEAMDRNEGFSKTILSQGRDIDEAQTIIDELRYDISELEVDLADKEQQILEEQEKFFAQRKVYNGRERAFEQRRKSHADCAERSMELSKEVSILTAKQEASQVVFDRMMSDKLVEIASKDQELKTLRGVWNNEPVTNKTAELHEAPRQSRRSQLECLQLSEETFKTPKRANDRQALADNEIQSAKIAQTFAEMNQQSAENYRDNLGEHVRELEAECDQAYKERDAARADAEKWRKLSESNFSQASQGLDEKQLMLLQKHAAHTLSPAGPPVSTTPVGTPEGYHWLL